MRSNLNKTQYLEKVDRHLFNIKTTQVSLGQLRRR